MSKNFIFEESEPFGDRSEIFSYFIREMSLLYSYVLGKFV